MGCMTAGIGNECHVFINGEPRCQCGQEPKQEVQPPVREQETHVHVHHHYNGDRYVAETLTTIKRKLEAVLSGQTLQVQEIERMSAVLDQIRADQATQDTLIGQVIVFLHGVPALTAAAVTAAEAGEAEEAAAIQADMEAHTQALSDALKAATPGSTTPAPAVPTPAPAAPAPAAEAPAAEPAPAPAAPGT